MFDRCHDVSNPAVVDLAHNHGAMVPFPGTWSGVVNGPVGDKAAMNNPPETYGIVERTYSEWVSSDLDTLRVNDSLRTGRNLLWASEQNQTQGIATVVASSPTSG